MPYVPSIKSTPPAEDRKILDPVIDSTAHDSVPRITNNFSIIKEYKRVFMTVAEALNSLLHKEKIGDTTPERLAKTIFDVGEKYEYEGAFLGELNYVITRFIQRVPGIIVENGKWKEELRYWLYASTVQALIYVSIKTVDEDNGISGVFEDIKDEYKRRVNTAYEAVQIVKSGDCYDGPYYTRLVEIIDESGEHVGYQEIMLKRDESTLNKDVLDGKFVLKK